MMIQVGVQAQARLLGLGSRVGNRMGPGRRSVVQIQRDLDLARNSRDGRFATPPGRLGGREGPCPRALARGVTELVPT